MKNVQFRYEIMYLLASYNYEQLLNTVVLRAVFAKVLWANFANYSLNYYSNDFAHHLQNIKAMPRLKKRQQAKPQRPQRTEVSNDKNPPKIRFKNLWNWLVICMAATFWHILKIKHLQWPETEIKWICWNLIWKVREITAGKLFFGGFQPFGTTVQRRPLKLLLRLLPLHRMKTRMIPDGAKLLI